MNPALVRLAQESGRYETAGLFNAMMIALGDQKNPKVCPECDKVKSNFDELLTVYNSKFQTAQNRDEFPTLSRKMLAGALLALEDLKAKTTHKEKMQVTNFKRFVMMDHTQCSGMPRFFLVTLEPKFDIQVMNAASGYATDRNKDGWDEPEGFGDKIDSGRSELGVHAVIPHTSKVVPPPSLQLVGLSDFNENAENRGVLIHRASYVPPMTDSGKVGNSGGCQAIPDNFIDEVTKEAGFMDFSYYEKAEQDKNKKKNSKKCMPVA